MSFWAIVPVKPLQRGKSRLAKVLSQEERNVLNKTMLGHTLKALSAVPEVESTLVISRDPFALALAREQGARTVQEDGSPNLNSALRRATVIAKVYAPEGVIILPADLPLITAEDIRSLLRFAKNRPVVVIAPDRRHDGTNALLVSPPGLIDYAFGPGSFERHCERARKAGARLEVCDLPSLGLDLDLPEDLELLRQMEVPLLEA